MAAYDLLKGLYLLFGLVRTRIQGVGSAALGLNQAGLIASMIQRSIVHRLGRFVKAVAANERTLENGRVQHLNGQPLWLRLLG